MYFFAAVAINFSSLRLLSLKISHQAWAGLRCEDHLHLYYLFAVLIHHTHIMSNWYMYVFLFFFLFFLFFFFGGGGLWSFSQLALGRTTLKCITLLLTIDWRCPRDVDKCWHCESCCRTCSPNSKYNMTIKQAVWKNTKICFGLARDSILSYPFIFPLAASK